jgi:hypothetical protein
VFLFAVRAQRRLLFVASQLAAAHAPRADLWITGESYAGKYIPYLAVHMRQQGTAFRLRGVAVGDGWSAPLLQTSVFSPPPPPPPLPPPLPPSHFLPLPNARCFCIAAAVHFFKSLRAVLLTILSSRDCFASGTAK